MNGFHSIAIDGPSGAGKSSLAKKLAEAFGFLYVDTGAIYRTVGLAAYRAGLSSKDREAVIELLPTLNIGMSYGTDGEQKMLLNGEDVSLRIRTPEMSIYASDVSAYPEVRSYLMDTQRSLAKENSVIMDGRDIGTVVLPNAELKIFLTASAEKRALRRQLQLQASGIEKSLEELIDEMRYRDAQDTERAVAPLKAAEDAITVDTSDMDYDESVAYLAELIINRILTKEER